MTLASRARLCAEFAASDDLLFQTIRQGHGTTAETRAAGQSLLQSWHGKPKTIDFSNPVDKEALRLLRGEPKPILLSDALARYLSEHKRGQDSRFARDATRAIRGVLQTAGDKPLKAYTRDDARTIRDSLALCHATATVRRRLGTIVAVFNHGRREFDISCGNPFEKLAIAREGLDAKTRLPFSRDEIARIAAACQKEDDDLRWIISLLLSTGARLGEIVGLRRADVILDCQVPHIAICHTRPSDAG
jgi:integrase